MSATNVNWQRLAWCLGVLGICALALCVGCPSGNGDGIDNGNSAGDGGGNDNGDGSGNDNAAGDDGDNGNTNDNGDDGGVDPNAPADAVTFTLTISIEGQGEVDPPAGDYDAGSELTLTPTPAAGWRFDRWEGDATGDDNPLSITLSEDMSITAVFLSFGDTGAQYYAVYDRILDTDELGDPFNIKLARMSQYGTNVFVTNGAGDGNDRKGWVINGLAGSSRDEFDLPDGEGQIRFLAVAGNGSRAYMTSGYEDEIYKWESGGITTIDVSGTPGPLDLEGLETTETGDEIFLLDNWNVWRVNADGTALTLVIEAIQVPVADGTGHRVMDISVDDSGRYLAFLLYIQRPAGDIVELFVWNEGTFKQLTDDRAAGSKAFVRICPHGGQIVYQDQVADEYVTIATDGTDRRSLVPCGYNFGGLALDDSGSVMFYNDSGGRGGKRVNMTSGEPFEIMPYTIALGITEQLCMTGDGGAIMFIYRWSSSPLKQGIYIGHFETTAVADKPHITRTRFSPMSMSRSAATEVALEFIISDPDGLDDVVETCADEMIDGAYIGEGANSPASFYDDPHDDGVGVDGIAADGWFTTLGRPGGKVNDHDEVTIRVGAKDASETIVIADVVLPIVP